MTPRRHLHLRLVHHRHPSMHIHSLPALLHRPLTCLPLHSRSRLLRTLTLFHPTDPNFQAQAPPLKLRTRYCKILLRYSHHSTSGQPTRIPIPTTYGLWRTHSTPCLRNTQAPRLRVHLPLMTIGYLKTGYVERQPRIPTRIAFMSLKPVISHLSPPTFSTSTCRILCYHSTKCSQLHTLLITNGALLLPFRAAIKGTHVLFQSWRVLPGWISIWHLRLYIPDLWPSIIPHT
ncbi:hypothetical protein BOTBODRAFT_363069 [Botryobasidium botryosum FD-172 SS1]|uniref:Uncharacterized protein n=1 Tax=Botryobasidium botryosum (strain FD-172 SS1) TaxID=930990 RepID=A0A067MQP1_BOTB1|nr:hypothetical protein BOTBODRAFT_363069 [Botryobasidium botryosum FD-172 SS1]